MTHKPDRVYVQQYGAFWSMSPFAWRRVCKARLAGEPVNFDDPTTFGLEPVSCKRIGKPNTVRKGERSYWSTSNAHPIFNILDWTDDDWQYALETTNGW